jgi:4-alpha-glucanotransferase
VLRTEAAARGIGLIGDVPIFLAHDSCDVWAHPELFYLDGEGMQTVVAGVPPDYFSATGQRWGNPLYRWDVLRSLGYGWWIARLRKSLERFDVLRLDHFIGFHRYWEIPADRMTAEVGRWLPGPGEDFFAAVRRALGTLPLIAEDLGLVTPEVKALRDLLELPGIRVLQFAFGDDPSARDFLPHNYVRRCVVYTGTHDNDTSVGWYQDPGGGQGTRTREEDERERRRARDYMRTDASEVHWDMIRLALMSVAQLCIVPAQDLCGLGSEARMNRPGRAEGNWEWRLRPGQLGRGVARRLLDLTRLYERLPAAAAPSAGPAGQVT